MKQLILTLLVFFSIASTALSQNRHTTKQKQQALFDSLKDVNRSLFLASKMDSIPALNKRMLQLAEVIKADSNYSAVYDNIGGYFSAKGNDALALEYKFKAVESAKKSAPWRLSIYYSNLSNTYSSIGDNEVALNYSQKAEQFLPMDKMHAKVSVSLSLAGRYINLRKPDSALKYVQQAYQQQLNDKPRTVLEKDIFNQNKGELYRHFAWVYQMLHEPELVDDYFKKAIRFSDSVNLPQLRAYASIDYCNYLLKQEKYAEAENYAFLSFVIARRAGYKKTVSTAANLLYRFNRSYDRTDSALYYSDVKNLYDDSLAHEEKIGRIQSLVISQQLHEVEENAKVMHDNEERKHNIQYVAIAFGLVLLIMVFLLLSRSIIVNTRIIEIVGVIGLLIVFEFINLVIHPYLAHLTDDSPILMLLILVLIAAIIVPVHHKLEEWIKSKLVEKNKEMRLAAAKKTIEQLEGRK